MTIYKYLPRDRIDVLERLRIRFSQHPALNDPFECWPRFTLKHDYEKSLRRHVKRWTGEIDALLKAGGASETTKESMRKLIAVAEIKARARMDALEDRGNPSVTQSFSEGIARRIGILCLSRSPLNLLMWAHYAGNHTGFAIGFNESHAFFP